MTGKRISHAFRKLHLWIALPFGAVFVLLGLSGSVIAWLPELDRMLNPDLLRAAAPPPEQRDYPAAMQALVAKLAADPRYGQPTLLQFPLQDDGVFVAWYRKKSGAGAGAAALAAEISRQVMLEPGTLRILGERNWGEPGLSRRLLMPTVFHLHRSLVSGESGKFLVGLSGLMLCLVALSGLVLWWPRMTLKAIRQALTVSHGGSWPRFNFRLHRAAGFFVAPVLLMLGFSGLYFNLPAWVLPAVNAFARVTPAQKIAPVATPTAAQISPAQALDIAQARYPQARLTRLALAVPASFEVRLRQPGELRQGDGATRLSIAAADGQVLRVQDPLTARGGDRFLGWLFPLHSGEAFGTAGRIFIAAFGVAPLLFFISGVLLWRRRRRH
ncbi:MAG: PepSY domain-containing protein [Burkholderiales bacterium]|nr:PepSY domain-containing protein [Burkholderiales bacterium]